MNAKKNEMKMEVEKRYYTEKEFAAIVGWHKESVANMRREGKIAHCKEGRKVWYLPEHIDAFNHRFERKAQVA